MESSNKGIVAVIVFAVVLAGIAFLFVGQTDEGGEAENTEPASAAAPAEDVKTAAASRPQAKSEPSTDAPPPPTEEEKPVPVQDDPELGRKPNPKLVKEPILEPVMPLDEKKGEKYDYVPLPNGGGFVFERWEPMPAEGEAPEKGAQRISGVVVPGIVLVTKGLVELFGCGDGGKEHETVVRLDCDIQSLDNALTLAGLKRGPLPKKLDLKNARQGSRVVILVQWTDKDGKLVTHRSEDLVVSVKRNLPMPRVGWTYVAQWVKVADPTSPAGEKSFEVLAAANSRSLITTFRDSSALLDNPLEEAIDDTLFSANYMLLPQSGTPVRVIFRAPHDTERKEILALEDSIRKEPKNFKPDQRGTEKGEPEDPFAPLPEKPKDGR